MPEKKRHNVRPISKNNVKETEILGQTTVFTKPTHAYLLPKLNPFVFVPKLNQNTMYTHL